MEMKGLADGYPLPARDVRAKKIGFFSLPYTHTHKHTDTCTHGERMTSLITGARAPSEG